MKDYDFRQIEKKWQAYWEKNNTFYTNLRDFSKPKYYILDMFPYPSGAGLHVGHMEGYTATDVVARMKRMQGFNVLHPMGYDSFGLPAEQFAIKTGKHPGKFTEANIDTFRRQLKLAGFSYDWDKEISTCSPSYYKWTQWIFKQLYKDGLAKYDDMPVNWCEELGTVLANDEIVDGKSERGGFPVVRKNMKQWVVKIPEYAQKLADGLSELDWPEGSKETQKNWIGRSEGVEVDLEVIGGGKITIFTTCIETIYGMTFVVLAPENALVDELKDRIQNWTEVEAYRKEVARKSEFDRTEMNKDKSGCELKGVKAINPANGKEVAVFLGDFVLANYGTGAVMAVPTHDQRDFDYAKKYNIPMIEVISGGDTSEKAFEKHDYLGKGCKLVNSEEFTGLVVEEAKEKITEKLVKEGKARKKLNFKLRDWIFARQRYWGEPVPIVHLENGKDVCLEDDQLPLVLPELDDYKSKNGRPPLDNAGDWKNVEIDGVKGVRETATMPGSAASSWYFLRYIDPHNDEKFADFELLKHWMPVDFYFGGAEHLVGHLLYSRFWNHYLYDKGLVPTAEPFKKLKHPGMILGADGQKMSKSKGNVVNPDDVIESYGADSLRLYILFMGPIDISKPWNTDGVSAAKKFIERIIRIFDGKVIDEKTPQLEKVYHETVKKVTSDYENMYFNTAISQIMIFVNAVYKENKISREYAEGLVKLISPIVPHVAEELWSELGHDQTIAYAEWPKYDEAVLVEDEVNIPIQINGKFRGTVVASKDATKEEIFELAKAKDEIAKFITTEPKKIIYIQGKIFNVLV